MIASLLEALTKVMYSGFQKEIYVDRLRQGFTSPCFFVREISATQTQELGNRRKRSHLMEIRYFPSDSFCCKKELDIVCSGLYEILEYIPFDSNHIIHGTDLRHVITDGVLVFTVNYTFCITRSEQKQSMERLKQTGGLKHG